jgi:WD40 repeat protein
MKLEFEAATRATLRSHRLLVCAAAAWLGSASCVVDNRLGVDDGGSGGKSDAGDPGGKSDDGGPAPVEAYALTGDYVTGQIAAASGAPLRPVLVFTAHQNGPHSILKPTTQTAPNLILGQGNGFVAAGDANVVWLFKSDGTLLRAMPHQAAAVTAVAISRDGTLLATADTDWTVHLFEVASGAELMPPFARLTPDELQTAWIGSLAIGADNAHVAAGGATGVQVWRASDGALVAQVPGAASSVALSAAGELAVARERDVAFYSLAGAMLGDYVVNGEAVERIAYSADGTKLAVGIRQFSNPPADAALIKILDRPSGTEAATLFDDQQVRTTSYGKPNSLTGIAFVENDAIVAVGWANRGVTVFGASDGVATLRFFIAE